MADIISIEYGEWKAGISPELGANVVYLKYGGEDVLVPLTDEKQLEKNRYIQGMPLLFPANRTRDGKFSWEGKTYSLPINEQRSNSNLHGFLEKCAFDVRKAEKSLIVLGYNHFPDENFPFSFEFEVTYSLGDCGFKQEYVLENTDERKFPFTFSVHTTFTEPAEFSVPICKEQERDEKNLPTGRWLELGEEKVFTEGAPSKGSIISGYYRADGTTARIGEYSYTVSDNFDHWILYNGQGKSGLLCVEPQCGAVDGLNITGMHRVIFPGEREVFKGIINRI